MGRLKTDKLMTCWITTDNIDKFELDREEIVIVTSFGCPCDHRFD